jgi:hypothetical protein
MTFNDNNDLNSISNDQTNNKKKPMAPTIGDAVKEAVETGKEVVMEGPTDAGDITGISTDNLYNANDHGKINKEIVDGIVMSIDNEDDSKISIDVKDSKEGDSLIQDKIIINPESIGEIKEATIATVTTIPTEKGTEVEVHTEVEVPIEDKDMEVESESKLNVKSANLSTSIPITEEQLPQPAMSSVSNSNKEVIPTRLDNPAVQQQVYDDGLLTKPMVDNTRNNYASMQNISKYPNANDAFQTETFKPTKYIADDYLKFQDQTIDYLQTSFIPILNNANNVFLKNQTLCNRLLEIYSRSSFTYIENAIALGNIMNRIYAANIFAYGNLFNYAKENFK